MVAVVLFDRAGGWRDTLLCEQRIADALRGVGATHGCDAGADAPAAGLRVLQPTDDDAGVYYLPRAEGWLGVLCDAGEWVAVPAALASFAAGAQEPGPGTALPSQDDFIAHLLSLMGEDAEEDAS
ncbi:MAG: hypothetical protein JWQ76_4323 [Ramlibacter sp.]|nr:hypothetical protein [Ramlibacter sp.]